MKKDLLDKIQNKEPLKIMVVSPLYPDDKDNYLNFDFTGNWEMDIRLITNAEIKKTIQFYKENDFDALINLCDAYDHPVQPGLNFLKILEAENILFTGTSSANYRMTKLDTKMAVDYTPAFVFVTQPELKEKDFSELTYPLLVKPNLGGGSYGIDEHSRVHSFAELEIECKKKLPEYPELIVEEYIDGREFTALVVENYGQNAAPVCLDPVECVFKNKVGFKSENVKWADDDFYYDVPKEPILSRQIKDMCEEVFRIFNLDGYVRMDIRANQNGKLFITDINPYCAIFSDESSSDFILESNRHIFKTNQDLLLHLIQCGYQRQINKFALDSLPS